MRALQGAMPKTNSTTIERIIIMNVKHVLAIAAILAAPHAFGASMLITKPVCAPAETGSAGCYLTNSSGEHVSMPFVDAFMNGDDQWELYLLDGNIVAIQTKPGGKQLVHFHGSESYLVRPAPPRGQMNSGKVFHGPWKPSTTTIAQAQAKAAADKAATEAKAKADFEAALKAKKVAEDKAYQDKMAAQDAADNQAAADKMKAEAAKAKAEMDKKAMDLANRTPVMTPVVANRTPVMAPAIAAAASGARTKP